MNEVGVGIVGAGRVAWVHANAFKNIAGVRVVAVVDVDLPRTLELAAHCHAKALTSVDQLVSHESVTLVDVCSPTPFHADAVIASLHAHKDVVVEKPLTRTLAEARRVLAEAKRSDAHLFVAHVLRFWPEYAHARELVQSGQLGAPVSAVAYRLSAAPAWASWYRDVRQSGGVALDLQIHDVDFLNWCFGKPVSVYSKRVALSDGAGDEITTLLTYGGFTALVEASLLLPERYPFTAGFRITGESGTLEYRMRSVDEVFASEKSSILVLYRGDGATESVSLPPSDPYVQELSHVVDCVRRGVESETLGGTTAMEALLVCEASGFSASSNSAVTLASFEGSQ